MICFKHKDKIVLTKNLNNLGGTVIEWQKDRVAFVPWRVGFYNEDYEIIPFPKEDENKFIIYIFQCDPTGRVLDTIRKVL